MDTNINEKNRICPDDLSSIDLKPLRELPEFSSLRLEDQNCDVWQDYYELADLTFSIDSEDFGFGNGDHFLQADEGDRYFADTDKNSSVDTCFAMKLLRHSVKKAPEVNKILEQSSFSEEKICQCTQDSYGLGRLGIGPCFDRRCI